MKSKQVGYVLMALIIIGIAGLIVRAITTESDELVLAGLLPVATDVVDKVVIKSDTSEIELKRTGDVWRIGNVPAFDLKLNQFWSAVSEIDGAQLISNNPDNHERIGVATGQGTTVSFFLGPSILEQFIIGNWTPQVQLCYVRRSGKDEVYAIPCPQPEVFASDPDNWRNPVVLSMIRTEVQSVAFAYPNDEFELSFIDGDWFVSDSNEQYPADLFQVDALLRTLQFVVAADFATDDEKSGLKFDEPDASVRIVTSLDATSPTTRLRFIVRDDVSYYVRTPTDPTVFILDRNTGDALLLPKIAFSPDFED